MRVLVDTNILVRISNGVEPEASTALDSLNRLRGKGHEPCLVPQNHYEFWTVATRPIEVNGLGMSTAETEAELARYSPPIFRLQGKVTHDTRLVAAMLRHGISHLLTFNAAHFVRFKEITALTPQEVLASSLGE